jgi:adenylate cyclase
VVTVLAGVLAAAASLAGNLRMNLADGLIYDLSLSLTTHRPGTSEEPVAVIALDHDSLASSELSATPRVFLGPVWAKLLDGLAAGGVKAIGFDIVLAYSANRFPGFDGQYDRDFLNALKRVRDRIVLARTGQQAPAFPYVAAVFNPATDAEKSEPEAIASIEMFPDSDGVQRRFLSRVVLRDGGARLTLAAALLKRAGEKRMPPQVLLAPAKPLEAIPTYRLVDVLRCVDSDPAAIEKAFAGKIVLIGTDLAGEDRIRTPDRFMRPPQPRSGVAGGCGLPLLGASDAGSRTVPGVFAHAAAVEEVVAGDLVRPLPRAFAAAAAMLAGLAGAALGFLLSPWLAAASSVLLASALFGIALLALPIGFWFPVVVPAAASGGSTVFAYVTRFVVEERRRQRVQRAFGHYLAPSLVDHLAQGEAELHLGGERRDISVMFADLSGFTALSGRIGPEALMAVTNRYLGHIVSEVEETGGYVDKFIGDAVMAIWGAPLADPDHAVHAAHAALSGVAAIATAKAEDDTQGRPAYSVKIGLDSGPAIVGNVGAARRYNYTAVGEMVNIAARLEGLPSDYGCTIVIGPGLEAAISGRFVTCELDWVKVKGKSEPLAVYELVAETRAASSAELAYPVEYAVALKLYRDGDFAKAAAAWLATTYPHASAGVLTPPQIMADRCAELNGNPPASWDGVFVKTTK